MSPEPTIRIITNKAMEERGRTHNYPYPVGAYPVRRPAHQVVVSESVAMAAIQGAPWAIKLIRHEGRHLRCPTWSEFKAANPKVPPDELRPQWEHMVYRRFGHPWGKPETRREKVALIWKQACHAASRDCRFGINAFTRYLRWFDWSPKSVREAEREWVRRELAKAWHKYRRPKW